MKITEEKRIMRAIYAGVRIQNNKKAYSYDLVGEQGNITFNSKLCSIEGIGTIVEADVEGRIWKNSRIVGKIKEGHEKYYLLTDYDAMSRAALEQYQTILDAKREFPASIQNKVNEIRSAMGFMSPRERARVARWVYEKLL